MYFFFLQRSLSYFVVGTPYVFSSHFDPIMIPDQFLSNHFSPEIVIRPEIGTLEITAICRCLCGNQIMQIAC